MTLNDWIKNKKTQDIAKLRRKKLLWEGNAAKAKTWAFLLLLIGEVVLFVGLAKMYGLLPKGVAPGEKIAVMDLDREITPNYVKEVIEHLESIKNEKEYRALLFIVNSPGGSPSAADELAAYLRDFNTSKPTYMYIQHIAASGGYYIASAIKPIYANPNAVVGSIGVILPHFSLEKLAQTLGIEEDDLTIGKYKKPISYIQKLTDEQKAYLKRHLLEPTYRNFLHTVAKYRNLKVSKLQNFADGKIYIANTDAIKGILVDHISHLHELKKKLQKKYGKTVKFVDLIPPKKPPFFGGKVDIKIDTDLVSSSGITLPNL